MSKFSWIVKKEQSVMWTCSICWPGILFTVFNSRPVWFENLDCVKTTGVCRGSSLRCFYACLREGFLSTIW